MLSRKFQDYKHVYLENYVICKFSCFLPSFYFSTSWTFFIRYYIFNIVRIHHQVKNYNGK